MRSIVAGLIGVGVLWPAAAAAELQWSFEKKDGRAYLRGMPNESEVDTEFWAHCRADRTIDIGLGADTNVGKGKGEAVTLTLTSGSSAVKVSGVSRPSANFQMTGGTELRARISREHALFAVLITERPIAVAGAARPMTWTVKGLKAKAAAFLQACK